MSSAKESLVGVIANPATFAVSLSDRISGHHGVEPVRLPARSPNLNAYAERFVLSIKSECLSRLILLGEAHLRNAVFEYVAHYNEERPHQGIDGRFVVPPANENRSGPIERRERLGGLLSFYHRHAA